MVRAILARRGCDNIRNRIVATAAPGVAAAEPAQRQEAAGPGAMAGDRFHGIGRTARLESAFRSQQGRDRHPIEPDQPAQDGRHGRPRYSAEAGMAFGSSRQTLSRRSAFSSVVSNSAYFASPVSWRAIS